LWDLNLVDPDNRRPVDFELRRRYLRELQEACPLRGALQLARDLVADPGDGRIKLYVLQRALQARRARGALFTFGSYDSLPTQGPRNEHVCAFARVHHDSAALVLAPRWSANLREQPGLPPLGEEAWLDTSLKLSRELSALQWHDQFTGERFISDVDGQIAIANLLRHFPVALLVAGPDSRLAP
jgi:(1->4)-alpha-D-glucan 1-alpha-D-glucosylmutase